ncbi:WecB/TagA/CpsF family glycosyltransferase [uncultured Pontibacter sp.]|uniref:WecB/TagA/CpsF family glycosyltransferase n=1 Tax=uncultured Pontibacter sp. TaxID=453356 RepID=UPI00261C4651|nr:WecB/TagA/CpsF family glycosyltransferase [uncultured Pontibacter sp.]
MKVLGYNISTVYPCIPSDKKIIINTINPHSFCVAKTDKNFQKALLNSDILIPDGIGIVWATKVLANKKIEKIAGYDIFLHLLKQINSTCGSCFFLGASEKTLALISNRISREFPNVSVLTYSPPYKATFSEEDSKHMYEAVNQVKPDVLFVGMTAPKQEKWVYHYQEYLDAKVICSIGAVFDFYAGTVKRPSKFWINMGLEWLPRFLKEPRRLAERNLISTPKFILEVLKTKAKARKS